jgi:hypothetical protein
MHKERKGSANEDTNYSWQSDRIIEESDNRRENIKYCGV